MAFNPFKRHAVRFDFDPFALSVESGISGTIANSQTAQSQSINGAEIFTGAITSIQVTQSGALSGYESFNGNISPQQPIQSQSINGAEIFTGANTSIQVTQSGALSGYESFNGIISTGQGIQSEAVIGNTPVSEIKSTVGGGGYAGRARSRELDRKIEALVYGIPANLEQIQREDEEIIIMLTALLEVEEWEVLQAA